MTLPLELGAVQDPYVRRAFEQLAQQFPVGASGLASGLAGTVLPAAPINGQEYFYVADATNGVVWHLKYRAASASASKWEYVGGPPLFSEASGVATTVAAHNVYQDLAGGPSITVPLAGDYVAAYSGRAVPATIGDDALATVTPTPTDTEAMVLNINTNLVYGAASRAATLKLAVAASTVMKLQYKCNANRAVAWQMRVLTIVPVRVG